MLRRPLLGLYVWMFDCNVEEAMETELKNYKNLGEFFRRILKPDVRLVSIKEELVNFSFQATNLYINKSMYATTDFLFLSVRAQSISRAAFDIKNLLASACLKNNRNLLLCGQAHVR